MTRQKPDMWYNAFGNKVQYDNELCLSAVYAQTLSSTIDYYSIKLRNKRFKFNINKNDDHKNQC